METFVNYQIYKEMPNSATTMEISIEIPQNIKYRTTLRSIDQTSEYSSKRISIRISKPLKVIAALFTTAKIRKQPNGH